MNWTANESDSRRVRLSTIPWFQCHQVMFAKESLRLEREMSPCQYRRTTLLDQQFSYCYSATHPIVLLFFFWLGRPLHESLRFRCFKSDQDEIWQTCSDVVLICPLNSKIAAMKSFHAEICCHLVSAHTASVGRIAAASGSSWSTVHSYLL